MPAPTSPEFRGRAVELARSREKPIAQIAKDLGIAEHGLRRARSDLAPASVSVRQIGSTPNSRRCWSTSSISAAVPGPTRGRAARTLAHLPKSYDEKRGIARADLTTAP